MTKNSGKFIFPHGLWDTPLQHLAKIIWNCSERVGRPLFPMKMAPIMFGLCIGARGQRVEAPDA